MPTKKVYKGKTYKDVIQSSVDSTNGVELSPAGNLLRLATQPAEPLKAQRELTGEEREIFEMIVTGELEGRKMPPFLTQVFSPAEVAIFTELVQQQEYPLFAHLNAGHFIRENISQNELLQLIDAGEAGLPGRQQQAQKLKADVVRLDFNPDRCLLTLFFRSARIAKQWRGSFCPFDRHGMQLIDYIELKRVSPDTVFRTDSYRFTIVWLRGKITPTEMHALLTKELKLNVVSLEHPSLSEETRDKEQWEVIVEGPVCPELLQKRSRIKLSRSELIVHLSDVHQHLPYTRYEDRWHYQANCPVKDDVREAIADNHTIKVASWDYVSPIRL